MKQASPSNLNLTTSSLIWVSVYWNLAGVQRRTQKFQLLELEQACFFLIFIHVCHYGIIYRWCACYARITIHHVQGEFPEIHNLSLLAVSLKEQSPCQGLLACRNGSFNRYTNYILLNLKSKRDILIKVTDLWCSLRHDAVY